MLVKPLVRPIVRAIAGNPTASLGSGFSPTSLFLDGSKGVVYDNNDLSSFYLDSATPATVNGLVGLQFDKSANLALGAELITNGTFPDATGWTANNSAVVSAVSGRLRVQNNVVDFGQAYASFTAVVGQVYAVTSDLFIGTSTSVRLALGNSAGSANAFGENFGADTTGIVRYVVANATTMYITVQCNTVNDTAYVEADNISVKAISGNHRYQLTTGSKPVLRGTPTGANLVTNGDFASGTGWTAGSGWAIGSGVATATTSSGTLTSTLAATASKNYRVTYTITRSAGSVQVSFGGRTGASRSAAGTYVDYLDSTTNTNALVFTGTTFSGTVDDVEVMDVSAGSVTAPYGLQYDGVDDFLQTAAVDFSATDKMFVCGGLLRTVTTGLNMLVESSTGGGVGSFYVAAPYNATSEYAWGLTASASGSYSANSLENLNIQKEVVSCQFDIGGSLLADEIKPRVNGAIPTLTVLGAGPAGTGSFGNHAIYFGRRGGTTFPFAGLDFGLVICGKTLTSTQISSTERYIAQRTGISL